MSTEDDKLDDLVLDPLSYETVERDAQEVFFKVCYLF
jgi:hypothetical protein